MDQIVLVTIGSVLAVFEILSPVTLVERFTKLLEKIGTVSATAYVREPARGTHKVRNYYVRNVK